MYDLKDLDYYAVESNLVWLFLIDRANRCQAFTNNDLGNIGGVSESFVQSLINELSFGERYDRLNYSVLGNISGDIECSLIPNMRRILEELDDIDVKKEKSYSLLKVCGCFLPLIGISVLALLFKWESFKVALPLFIICVILFAIFVIKLCGLLKFNK